MLPLLLVLATLASTELPQLGLAPRNGVLRFAVTGDTGRGSEEVSKGIARVHAGMPLDGIILTGDNFYPCGPKTVSDPMWSKARPLTRIGIPVFPVLGNHDFCGASDPDAQIKATATLPNWRFPARQYVARSALADFLFVDTTPLVKGTKHAAETAIRGAFRTSKAPWRIVVGHHPVVSSGYHGYFPRIEVSRMREMIPALRDAKADLYICGHDHHVEFLRGRMMHLVSGAGSHPIPPIKLRTTTVFPEEVRRERIGFAVLEITATRVRVRFYDAKGKARSNWIVGRTRTLSRAGINLLGVRSQPAAKGPVLFRHLDEVDEDVVRPHTGGFLHSPGDIRVERAFDLDGAAGIERDLDEDHVVGTIHPRIRGVGDEIVVRDLVDDLEAVVGGNVRLRDERLVNGVRGVAKKFGRLSFAERDADERHDGGL
jgi:hypothetical protein